MGRLEQGKVGLKWLYNLYSSQHILMSVAQNLCLYLCFAEWCHTVFRVASCRSCDESVLKMLNERLECKNKSTDVKQLVDENRNSETISGNNNIAEKFS